jgi:hypothetical protein
VRVKVEAGRVNVAITSITGLQSHAVRLHGLQCDFRRHLSEFNNPGRRRKLLRRVMQNGSAEQQLIGITANLSLETATTADVGSSNTESAKSPDGAV